MKWIRSWLWRQAHRRGRFVSLYRRFCRPDAREWAEFLRAQGRIFAMGQDVHIMPSTVLTDPELTRIGSNVMLAGCHLIAHDGSVAMLNKAYGERLDAVGAIDIRDNVFIGYQAIILAVNGPLKIGPNAIIAAGSVVMHDVPEGAIVGGVPAREIGRTAWYVQRLRTRTKALPWGDLIASRQTALDHSIEAELLRRRQAAFFEDVAPAC